MYILNIIMALLIIAIGHWPVSFLGIGNRPYSIWFSSHCLIKKRGFTKLIYFSPKHFGCFSVFEVISFFGNYFLGISILITASLAIVEIISLTICNAIMLFGITVSLVYKLIIILLNDIKNSREEKYFDTHNTGMSSTTYKLAIFDYYQKNCKKSKNTRDVCVNAFKNYKNAYLERVNNKDYYAIIYVKSNSIEKEFKLKY